MNGEVNLDILLKTMKPKQNAGKYVFCTVRNLENINLNDIQMIFREEESTTIIIRKEIADALNLKYSFVACWISLNVHSALEAVGLTAAFSKALSEKGISCNVVAGFYHDHLFVDQKDGEKAMQILKAFSE